MRVAIYGAGAIGGHLAARLSRGGAEVSVIARGAQLAAIQDRGLTLHARDASFTVHVPASADPAALGPQDMVIVSVKAPALPAVAAGILPLLGPQTSVVFAMNGIPWWYFYTQGDARLPLLDPGDALWSAVTPQRVIGGVVYSSCTVVAPGVIEAINPQDRLVLGEPDGTMSARATALAAALRDGGMVAEVSTEIRREIWKKLLLNMSSGPLSVLTQSPSQALAREPGCQEARAVIIEEAGAIAAAMGYQMEPLAQRSFAGGGTKHLPSIAQDLLLGRPMEIDAIYTVPLEMARARGVATPVLDIIVGLVKVRARAEGLYL